MGDLFDMIVEESDDIFGFPEAPPTVMALRDYQSNCVASVLHELKTNASTLYVMATGTGKSCTFAYIAKSFLERGRILILAHRQELIYQAQRTCKSVLGFDPEIEMGDQWADRGAQVVISTVQTQGGSRGGRKNRFNPNDFSLIIQDEAHHSCADSYKEIYKYYRQNPALKIVGCTATPDRADEEALGQIFDSVAFEYELPDAIRDGWLVMPHTRQVYVDSLDFSKVRTTAGDLNGADLAAVMEEEANLHKMADPIYQLSAGRQTLIFAASVAHAERLCEILNRHKPDCARFVCGTTPDDVRKKMLWDYQDRKFQFLTNCGVCTEGFDCPGIEVVIPKPTKSRALFAQMVGRGTRTLPGTVDGIPTAAGRLEAIAASGKPFCIAEGQRVLTDRGLVPIERVTSSMKVWDGLEFVANCGSVFRGEQRVITYAGLTATPDHKVWTNDQTSEQASYKVWTAFGNCATQQIAIAVTGDGRKEIREADGYFRGGCSLEVAAQIGLSLDAMRLRCAETHRLLISDVGYGWLSQVWSACQISAMALQAMSTRQRSLLQSEIRQLSELWSAWDKVRLSVCFGNDIMDSRESWSEARVYTGQDRQRRKLRTGKHPLGNPEYSMQQSEGTTYTKRTVSRKERVFDIVNAGPRHRFTAEGLLVSNCEIIDFCGNTGRHELVSTVDILGGNYSPQVQQRAKENIAKEPGQTDPEAQLKRAKKQLEDEERSRAEMAKRAVIIGKASFTSSVNKPFATLGIQVASRGWDRPATAAQHELLAKNKFDSPGLTQPEAGAMIGEILRRRKLGMATVRQGAILKRNGFEADMSFSRAKKIIDILAGNSWRWPQGVEIPQ